MHLRGSFQRVPQDMAKKILKDRSALAPPSLLQDPAGVPYWVITSRGGGNEGGNVAHAKASQTSTWTLAH